MDVPSTMNVSQDATDPATKEGPIPSGFILKLFQMVNGAPDDLISWTPSGDSFRVGEDLSRLESETLPQYFRHSRFQSLVRQLNFYNFRKVNRERTFWVYKHHLFHRDKPENLHMLRRRTCPGVDGRKQRYVPSEPTPAEKAALGARRSNRTSSASSSDSGSSDDASPGSSRHTGDKKRKSVEERIFETKRSRVMGEAWHEEENKGEDPLYAQTKPPRHELIEQSMVVSEVARKLEEYAREAKKPGGLARLRGDTDGVVTPPGGGMSYTYIASRNAHAGELLTYDDEYEGTPGQFLRTAFRQVSTSSSVASEEEDLLSSATDEEASAVVSLVNTPDRIHDVRELVRTPPIKDAELAKTVAKKLVLVGNGEWSIATAAVVTFCMMTAPGGGNEFGSQVLRLITSSERLASEFQSYRAALHPLECSTDPLPSFAFNSGLRKDPGLSVQQIWERATSRNEALRDFKTFAVNIIQNIIEISPKGFSRVDMKAMSRTAEAWLKSACIS